MEIVFLRHGKAEPPSDAKPEVARELTSLGRKKIKQAARGLAASLFPGGKILIWTSPTTRTQQTAQLLKDEFGKRAAVKVVDAVASGTLDELRSEWSVLPADAILFIVGHEPMLGEWIKALCGAHLSLRPASAAAVTFDDHTGLLEWFMRSGVMARLGVTATAKRRQRS